MQELERYNNTSVVGKVLGRIVIDRIRNGVDNRLKKEQGGYRKGRGTTDQIFIQTGFSDKVNYIS